MWPVEELNFKFYLFIIYLSLKTDACFHCYNTFKYV